MKTAVAASLAAFALSACKSSNEPPARPMPVAEAAPAPAAGERPTPSAQCDPPAPVASDEAKKQHLHGVVVASFTVEADGHVDNVRALNPNAPPLLVEAVRDWLAHCRYTPQLRDGQPAATTMFAPFQFKDDAP